MKIRSFKCMSLVGLIGLFTLQLKAQDKPANGVWTLRQCVEYAYKNNITLLTNEQNLTIAGNNLQQSKYDVYPTVNANASQAFNWGRSIDPFTNQFVNQRVNSNNFSLNASLPVFGGFQRQNRIRQNRVDAEVSRLNYEQSKNDISLNVALGYLNILLNEELLRVAQQNVLSTQAQLDRTQKLFDAGSVAENDVVNLKAQMANNELAVVNAQNQLILSKVNLQQLMNLPVEDNFQIERVNIDNLMVDDVAEKPQQIFMTAEATQFNVKSADMSIKSNEYAVDVARAGFYPTLTLNGVLFTGYSSATKRSQRVPFSGVDTVGFVGGNQSQPVTNTFNTTIPTSADYPFFNQLDDNFRQQVSLQLSIPIFNGWQSRTNVQNAIIQKRISELNAKNVRNTLRQTIEQSYTNAKAAYNTYDARKKQVESLQLTFDITEKRYNAGAANVVDFNLSKFNLDNAKSDLVRAKYDYLFRKKVLDFYQNKPLDIE